MLVLVSLYFMLSGMTTESQSDYSVMTSCSDDAICFRVGGLRRSVVSDVLHRRDLKLYIFRGIIKNK